MDHFYQEIPGWFNFQDIYARQVRLSADGAHFVEVGVWYGRSASFMAVEILNSGKRIRFDVVDTWEGSPEHRAGGRCEDPNIVERGTVYPQFLRNIARVRDVVHPLRLLSVEASALYEDESLDFVFLDAAHDYGSVRGDLASWYPKVKPGGRIGGHDFWWPGVKRAVREFFPRDGLATRGTSWIRRKPD